MMTDEQVLAAYASLRQLLQRLQASTGDQEWEQVAQQQEELSTLMERLQGGEGQASRPAIAAARKALIEEILVLQKATMDITLSRRDSFAAMLDSAGSAKRIARAYGQGA
jgi:hypothetical protein